jgi:hypothetical protein
MIRNVLGEIRRIPASAAPLLIPPNALCGSGSIRKLVGSASLRRLTSARR